MDQILELIDNPIVKIIGSVVLGGVSFWAIVKFFIERNDAKRERQRTARIPMYTELIDKVHQVRLIISNFSAFSKLVESGSVDVPEELRDKLKRVTDMADQMISQRKEMEDRKSQQQRENEEVLAVVAKIDPNNIGNNDISRLIELSNSYWDRYGDFHKLKLDAVVLEREVNSFLTSIERTESSLVDEKIGLVIANLDTLKGIIREIESLAMLRVTSSSNMKSLVDKFIIALNKLVSFAERTSARDEFQGTTIREAHRIIDEVTELIEKITKRMKRELN